MSKEDKEQLENNSLNPIKQNFDYGGNFLDKIRRRIERRRRKRKIKKMAQGSFNVGDRVKFLQGRYATMEGVISGTKELEDGTTAFIVETTILGRKVPLEEPASNLELVYPKLTDHDLASFPKEEHIQSNIIEEAGIKLQRTTDDNWMFPQTNVLGWAHERVLQKFNQQEEGYYSSDKIHGVLSALNSAPTISHIMKQYFLLYNIDFSANLILFSDEFVKENYNKILKLITEPKNEIYVLKNLSKLIRYFPDQIPEIISKAQSDHIFDIIFSKHGKSHSILKLALQNKDSELYKALEMKAVEVPAGSIIKNEIYRYFPEAVKEILLTNSRITGSKRYLEKLKEFYPEEIAEIKKQYWIRRPKDALLSDFDEIWESFSDNLKFRFFQSVKANVKPEELFHAFNVTKFDQNIFPQEFWIQQASALVKENPLYFMFIQGYQVEGIPEELVRRAYNISWEKGSPSRDLAALLQRDVNFRNLVGKFGVPRETLLKKAPDIGARCLREGYEPYSNLVFNLTKELQEPFDQNEQIFAKTYVNGNFWKHDPNSGENLAKFFNSPDLSFNISEKDKLIKYINHFESDGKEIPPFISEDNAKDIIEMSGEDYRAHQDLINNGFFKRIINPSDEFTREYAKNIATYNPEFYFAKNLKGQRVRRKTAEEFFNKYIKETDLSEKEKAEIMQSLKEQYENDKKETGGSVYERFPEFKSLAISNLVYNFRDLNSAIKNLKSLKISYEEIERDARSKLVKNIADHGNPKFILLNDQSDIEIFETVKRLNPQELRDGLKNLAEEYPEDFFNIGLYPFVNDYKDLFLLAVQSLSSWTIQKDVLLRKEEFYTMLEDDNNFDILKTYFDKILEDTPDRGRGEFFAQIFKDFPVFLKVLEKGESLSISMMKYIEDREAAIKLYPGLKNDIEISNLPNHIKINFSIYQTQQRPNAFSKYKRYTIANNNVNPTNTLYDIGKKLIHAGDGVEHTNVGTSGFTNSWSLVSFVDKDGEYQEDLKDKELIIEQYQSDYPPVLHELFGGENKKALNNLIQKYADPQLLKEFEEQRNTASPRVGSQVLISKGDYKHLEGEVIEIIDYSDHKYYTVKFSEGIDEANEVINFEIDYLLTPDGERYLDPRGIDYPIDIAPEVKDARKHFEYISKVYPFVSIINAIKVAQSLNKDYIYIVINTPRYAAIRNKDKANKLYTEIPLALGAEEDAILEEPVWRIPATQETIDKAQAMAQEATGKNKDYDYSLTPSQNIEEKEKRLRKEKKKKRQWKATPEKIEQLEEINEQVRTLLPEVEVPDFVTPQQALRYLNQEVNGKIINKKRFKRDFGLINRNLGMLSRAHRRRQRMIKMASLTRRINILKGFNDENQQLN